LGSGAKLIDINSENKHMVVYLRLKKEDPVTAEDAPTRATGAQKRF
jgi:hypothetical protein